MEKETLEEAAERNHNEQKLNTYTPYSFYDAFKDGAKWQSERMYSEEELKSAFKIGFNIGYGSPVSELDLKEEHCTKWFEQFKKK